MKASDSAEVAAFSARSGCCGVFQTLQEFLKVQVLVKAMSADRNITKRISSSDTRN